MSNHAYNAAVRWCESFSAALLHGDAVTLAQHFADDGNWRDILGFGWNIETLVGRDEIASAFAGKLASIEPRMFRLSGHRAAPRSVRRAGVDTIEAFVDFETSSGNGSGVVCLIGDSADSAPPQAWILLTCLSEVHGHPESFGSPDRSDAVFKRDFGGENWLEQRTRRSLYADREPRVLVIGAGQAGLSIAARLGALSIDTLIVDRNEEIGDNWRNRYHALALHNDVSSNHLPYMPFPPAVPKFVPKDKLANWFETYADSMDLNVWMKTSLAGGTYDERQGQWTIEVIGPAGSCILHPNHVVFATGVSAIPVHPQIPGLQDFRGTILHSGAYEHGHAWSGRNVAVLGTGNSGHDVAQDLHACGADVTLVQRSPTTIVSLQEAQKLYAIYREGLPLEDADLLTISTPYPVMVRNYRQLTAEMRAADHDLLEALERRGFRLDFGEDDTGFQMKYLTRGGGYYFNVGCSDLIVSGEIDLIQYSDVDRLVPDGIRMKDNTVRPVELLVTATGFKNQQDTVREHLGDQIADRIGPIWGFGDGRELRNMWTRTPQPGLWFTAGSFTQCRVFSKYLALQILATELGLIKPAQAKSARLRDSRDAQPILKPA
jgi:cation diffusion facilitator CzcD-associated flavoprotein CzcO